uniref:Uncharacterized protein n=1 Tax=Arundo donax TaxID=35708 RepID=A0A0A8XQC6_ARUDO
MVVADAADGSGGTAWCSAGGGVGQRGSPVRVRSGSAERQRRRGRRGAEEQIRRIPS